MPGNDDVSQYTRHLPLSKSSWVQASTGSASCTKALQLYPQIPMSSGAMVPTSKHDMMLVEGSAMVAALHGSSPVSSTWVLLQDKKQLEIEFLKRCVVEICSL